MKTSWKYQTLKHVYFLKVSLICLVEPKVEDSYQIIHPSMKQSWFLLILRMLFMDRKRRTIFHSQNFALYTTLPSNKSNNFIILIRLYLILKCYILFSTHCFNVVTLKNPEILKNLVSEAAETIKKYCKNSKNWDTCSDYS